MESREVMRMKRVLPLLLLAILLAGCQTPKRLYYWGHYESLAYQSYVNPDKATPELQVEKLEEDVQKAAAANLPVHPGLHAHLGYLYYQMGRFDVAHREFETEKTLFPESTSFIDRMVNATKQKPVP
jgi:hypothetical protein